MKKYHKKKNSFTDLILMIILGFLFYQNYKSNIPIFYNKYVVSSLTKTYIPIIFLVCSIIIIAGFLINPIKKHLKRKQYLKSDLSKIDKLSGEEFEDYLEAHFRNLGYRAKVTQKSNDYGADLVMFKDGNTIVVQAKRYNSKVGIKAIQEIVGSMGYYNAVKAYVVTNSFFTKQAINLANANGIELWDRDVLKEKFFK